MEQLLKKRPKFSLIILATFLILFVSLGIYIVFFSKAADKEVAPKVDLASLTFETLNNAKEYKNAKPEEKQKAGKKLKDTAKLRKKYALAMMENDPEGFLKIAISKDIRKSMLTDVAADIEEETTLEGEFKAEILDDFEKGTSKTNYYLKTNDGKSTKLIFNKEPNIQPKSRIRVKGYFLESTLLTPPPEGEMITRPTPEISDLKLTTAARTATKTKKVAALLIYFTDLQTRTKSNADIKNLIFGTSGSVRSYYKEVSYGKVDLVGKKDITGDVYGWFQIPVRATCDNNVWKTQALAAAKTKYGFDPAGYDSIVIIGPSIIGSCGWAGRAATGYPESFINGYYSRPREIIHEMGHTFGLMHASKLKCTLNGAPVRISSNCTLDEYGDFHEVMGGAPTYNRHFSFFHKEVQGFVDPISAKTVTAAGTYDLYPVETSTATAVRIPIEKDASGNQKYYHIEYRQPIGLDGGNFPENGVLIRIVTESKNQLTSEKTWVQFYKTNLLDMGPTTATTADEFLFNGQTFEDTSRKVKIKVTSAGSTKATVEVTPPPAGTCIRSNPTITVYPWGQWGLPGSTLSYNVTVTNHDTSGCAPVTFSLTGTNTANLSISPSSQSITISPQETIRRTVTVSSTTSIANGSYPFDLLIKNTAATSFQNLFRPTYNVFR